MVLASVFTSRDGSVTAAVQALVNKQAGDDGLWFDARTAPEAYLQQELRRLHALLEQEDKH